LFEDEKGNKEVEGMTPYKISKKRFKTIAEVRKEMGKMFKKVKSKSGRAKWMKKIWKRYKPKTVKKKRRKGGRVKARPPAEWMAKMRIRVMAQYPDVRSIRKEPCKSIARKKGYKAGIDCIVAGIWHDYSDATKRRLIKKYG